MLKSLCTALALVTFGCGTVLGASIAPSPDANRPMILAANGCGPGFFRTIDGDCRPNQRVFAGDRRAPPPCPRGYLRDPDPARPVCYPIF